MARAKTREERMQKLLHDGEKMFYATELKKKGLWLPFLLVCAGLLLAFYPDPAIQFAAYLHDDFGALASGLLKSDAGKFLGGIIVLLAIASGSQAGTKQRNNLHFITNQRVVRVTGFFDPELREFYHNRVGFIKLKRTFWERLTSVGNVLIYDNSWSMNSKNDDETHCIRMESIYFPDRFRHKLKDAVERYKDIAEEREKENPSMEKAHMQADFSHGSRKRKGRGQTQKRSSGKSRKR